MTIIQLEYLLAVANRGSFSLAAQDCFVTQPSLSMQIKSLEEELGAVLLDRSKKPVIPTETGVVVLERVRRALMDYEDVKESVLSLRGEIVGSLRLGMLTTVGPYFTAEFLPRFIEKYPQVTVDYTEAEADVLNYLLEHDQLDAAVMAGRTSSNRTQEYELFGDTFHAYVSPQNNLFGRSSIKVEDIDMRQLILLKQGHCLRDQIVEICGPAALVRAKYNFECATLETVARLVDKTDSVTILPEMSLKSIPPEKRDQIKTLEKGTFSRKIVLAVRRTYVKHMLIEALKEVIRESRKE